MQPRWPASRRRQDGEGSEFSRGCGLVLRRSLKWEAFSLINIFSAGERRDVGGFSFFIKLISSGERREEASPWASTTRGDTFGNSRCSNTIVSVLLSNPKQSPALGRRAWKWTTSFRLGCESSDRRVGSPRGQEGRSAGQDVEAVELKVAGLSPAGSGDAASACFDDQVAAGKNRRRPNSSISTREL